MTFSWKRVNAIFVKDYKDFSRNMAISVIVVFPPILAAFYGRLGADSLESYYMLINMAFTMVAAFTQSCLIAEEKEKNTLRGLMLSPASTTEILTGKSLLTLVLTLFTILISMVFMDYRPANIPVMAVSLMLSAVFYIGVGTLLGLYAKSVMEASVLVLPVIALFSFGSFIPAFAEKYPVLQAAEYLPSVQLIEIAQGVEAGAGMVVLFTHLGIILIWTIAAFAVAFAVYRKRMVD